MKSLDTPPACGRQLRAHQWPPILAAGLGARGLATKEPVLQPLQEQQQQQQQRNSTAAAAAAANSAGATSKKKKKRKHSFDSIFDGKSLRPSETRGGRICIVVSFGVT